MTTSLKSRLAAAALTVEVFLGECLKGRHIPCALLKAMDYSLLAGGKRLRPVLCLTTAGLFGMDREKVMPFAASLELIHTYSLIHDDLPAMDDDDLRRGKPSNHKVHGEAMAILAGDGLLTEAFYLMTRTDAPAQRVVQAIGQTAIAVGGFGMVGGQALDMEFTGRAGVSVDQLKYMHSLKTGALIRISCLSGAILAGAGEDDIERVSDYGRAVGAAFQIVDDILDEIGDEKQLGKPVGSDRDQGKTTYPSLIGLDRSRELAESNVGTALESIAPYRGEQADFLRDLARYILERAQ